MRHLLVCAVGLFACGSQPPTRYFGELANDAIEQFDSLCHEYRGGHAMKDPTLQQARSTESGRERVHGDTADSYVCDAGDGGVIALDRNTRELLLFDMVMRESELPLVQRLLRPTLTPSEQIGLLGEVQRVRVENLPWEKRTGSHHSFFDGHVILGVTFHSEDNGIRYVHVMAFPQVGKS